MTTTPQALTLPPARLTVILNVYHQQPAEEPAGVEGRFVRSLPGDSEPRKKRFLVGAEWAPLPLECPIGSLVVLANEGQGVAAGPGVAGDRTIEIAFAPPAVAPRDMHSPALPVLVAALRLPVGEVQPLTPAGGPLRVRCPGGQALCLLHVFGGGA